MPEYVGRKPEAVTPGETVMIDNRCENPVEVGTGLIFREDGDYSVSVRDGRITVRKSGDARKMLDDVPPEITEAVLKNAKRIKEKADQIFDELVSEKRAEIERLESKIAMIPPMDYEKLAANPPEPPKEAAP